MKQQSPKQDTVNLNYNYKSLNFKVSQCDFNIPK
jgi:hypothetical protein